jgi:DNA-binding LacI/PurR family transcriptional regulator
MNIRDIAKLAGVTHTTVSKILNNKGSISEETKKKVLAIIKKNNFYPSEAARRTSLGRGGEIAFVSTKYASPFISTVLEGVENSSYGMGKYEKMLSTYSTRGSEVIKDETFMKIATGRLADAVIVLALKPNEDAMKEFKKAGIPVILLESRMKGADSITVDNVSGAYDAVSYLAGTGRKHIAIIRGVTGNEEVGPVPHDREKGYKKALLDAGLKTDKNLLEEVIEYTFDEGRQALDNLLANNKKIDSIFCAAGDMCALGVMQRAQELRIKIPQDISIIGFDDIPAAALVKPGLATVKQPVQEMGKRAFAMAVDHAENRLKEPINVVIKPELIIRESAG